MDDIDRLSSLFQGAEDSYGAYIPPNGKNEGEKEDGESYTEHKPVTRKIWERHVSGMRGLGIIPIKPDNTCVWGCIDVDDYPPDIDGILKIIKEKKLPLNPCYSKSGGLHLFLFVLSPVKPVNIQKSLRDMAKHLFGKQGKEIFPKQLYLVEGQTGNWLNMPFFGDTRLGIGPNKEELSLSQFLNSVIITDPSSLSCYGPSLGKIYNTKDFPDGPPCIQAICSSPVREGNRNETVMAMAVYYHKRFPDDFGERLLIANSDAKLISPPLPDKDVRGIIDRVTKGNYRYRCGSEPLHGHCEHDECLKRKYGIEGGKSAGLVIDKVIQYRGEGEDLWHIWMNHREDAYIEVTTPELLSQKDFGAKYFQIFNRTLPKMTDREWREFVDEVGQKAEIVNKPEGGLNEKVRQLLAKYIEIKKTENRNEVINGQAWVDDKGYVWFRISALELYMSTQHVGVAISKLSGILGKLGAIEKHFSIKKNEKNTTTRAMRLSVSALEEELEIVVKSPKDVL